jgi:Predicted phosphatase homologous to the C-terminal domain of histone macroH2A1
MIKYTQGNLLEADVDALVNTVNCVGVMGKGIALQFKQAFPSNYKEYEKACKAKQVKPGKMFIYNTGKLFGSKYIINFPTKRHWKGKSRIEDIENGLVDFVKQIKDLNIKSVAVPPLGCGNGGLNWNSVKLLMEKAFENLGDVDIYIYPPNGAPAVDTMPVNTTRPALTKARSLLICLMQEYGVPGYRLSKLEIQKLAYFLQEMGEPLRLNFVKGLCGPYADNLNHVLQRLEGHYIRGYGDRAEESNIVLLPTAVEEAEALIKNEVESQERLKQVKNIILGFESPYGLELLSTVHWIIKTQPELADDIEQVTEQVRTWNNRKCKLFKPIHVEKAWLHLKKVLN